MAHEPKGEKIKGSKTDPWVMVHRKWPMDWGVAGHQLAVWTENFWVPLATFSWHCTTVIGSLSHENMKIRANTRLE